jgi:hypothetical protein
MLPIRSSFVCDRELMLAPTSTTEANMQKTPAKNPHFSQFLVAVNK